MDAARVWEEVQAASRGMYNEFSDGAGQAIRWDRLSLEGGIRWGGDRRYLRDQGPTEQEDPGAIFPRRFQTECGRARLVVPRSELLEPVATDGDRFNLITGRGTIGPRSEFYGVRVFNSGVKCGGDEPPEHAVFVSPFDADRLGIAPGELVRLTSDRGALIYPAQIAGEVPPGHLFLSFFPDSQRRTPNTLLPSEHFCPHVFQPRIKILPVQLERVC